MNARNIEMVSKLNNLQGKIDQVAAQEKELDSVKEQLVATKSENQKLRELVKKKMSELTVTKQKQEADLKTLTEKHQVEVQTLQ